MRDILGYEGKRCVVVGAATGMGDACSCTLVDFQVQSVTAGLDSIGTVTIRVQKDDRIFSGRGASTDVIVASAKAYLSAVNRMMAADEESDLPAVGTTPD